MGTQTHNQGCKHSWLFQSNESQRDTFTHLVDSAWDQTRDVGFPIKDFWKRRAETRCCLDGWKGVLANVCLSIKTKNTPGLVVGDPSLNSADSPVELPSATHHTVSELHNIFCLNFTIYSDNHNIFCLNFTVYSNFTIYSV